MDSAPAPPHDRAFHAALVFEAGLGVVALAAGALFGVAPVRTLAFDPADAALGVAATVPMVAVFFALDRSAWQPLARIRALVERTLVPLFAGRSTLEIAVTAALAGLGEELLFRGFIQAALEGPLGPVGALLAASALFGLAHLVTPTYGVLATLTGLYLGGLWIGTGNLLVPIVVHGLYDFVVLLWLARRATAQPPPA